MKFLSLFSGIGGFDKGFEDAGMECVGVCEIDKDAQAILRRHFPYANVHEDVRLIGKDTYERGSIDLVCGGFPCQDVSIAGRRAGLAGERSGLWFEFARIVDELEPRWVVIENVPGLLSSWSGDPPPSDLQEGEEWETTEESDFLVIIQWLAQRGYGVAWRVLDAQYFGVPQRRRRVFIIGSFGNGRAAQVLFERESLPGNPAPRRKAGQDITPPLGGVSNGGGANGPGRDVDSVESLQVVGTFRNMGVLDDQSPTLEAQHGSGTVFVMAHGQANAEVVSDGEPSLTTNHEAPILFENEPVTFVNLANSGANQNNAKVSNTLDTWNSFGIQRQAGIRRLTPVECERLQGFPDGWTDGQSDSVRYRQLGNAVARPVAEWLGARIVLNT